MSLAEASKPVAPIFGPIEVSLMRENEALTRKVLTVVREACKHSKGRFTEQSVADGLANGEMKVWGVLQPPVDLKAAVVTRVADGVFEILIAGPEFRDVAPFMDVLKKFARGARCERMRLWGASFFREHLPKGWRPSAVLYECIVDAD
jgi:hypothetical protein